MYYEINISQHGSHYFATAERSITTKDKAKEVLSTLLEKFPKSEGFQISISHNFKNGYIYDVAEFLQ